MQAARDSRGILFGDSWPRREGVEREGEREREREAGRESGRKKRGRWAAAISINSKSVKER